MFCPYVAGGVRCWGAWVIVVGTRTMVVGAGVAVCESFGGLRTNGLEGLNQTDLGDWVEESGGEVPAFAGMTGWGSRSGADRVG